MYTYLRSTSTSRMAVFSGARSRFCQSFFSCLQTYSNANASGVFQVVKLGNRCKGVASCLIHSSCHQNQHVSASCSQQETVNNKDSVKPWKLASAVCLERFPVVSEEMSEIERSYFDMVSAMELEQSALSQHELSVAADRRRMARRQAGGQEEEEGDGGDLLTALDLEDLATEELANFQTAPRVTDDDEKDNRQSLNRRLADKLVLLVKCKVGENSVWMLPSSLCQEEETMRDAAQRTLTEHTNDGGSLRVHFMGNAPVGFYKQRYPRSIQEDSGSSGVKMFFFKAQHVSGEFKMGSDSLAAVEDYVWVTRDEIDQYLDPSYLASVQKFILPV